MRSRSSELTRPCGTFFLEMKGFICHLRSLFKVRQLTNVDPKLSVSCVVEILSVHGWAASLLSAKAALPTFAFTSHWWIIRNNDAGRRLKL